MRLIAVFLLARALLPAQDRAQFEASHTFAQDSVVNEYVQRIASRLAAGVTARVTTDIDVRAASVPGDRIYVTAPLIARAANEAELAGVLAHEIAHSRGAREAGRTLFADSEGGLCARFAGMKMPGDAEVRERERAADGPALKMLAAAGYDPAAMLAFFSKLRREKPEATGGISAEDLLLEKLQLEATDHPLKDAVVNTAEFDRVRARVEPQAGRQTPPGLVK